MRGRILTLGAAAVSLLLTVALGLSACDGSGRFSISGHEFRGENTINVWLKDIKDGNAEEACAAMTPRYRRVLERQTGIGTVDFCSRFVSAAGEGDFGLPVRVAILGSKKLGGSDALGKGVYRFETNTEFLFRVNRDRIDGVFVRTKE